MCGGRQIRGRKEVFGQFSPDSRVCNARVSVGLFCGAVCMSWSVCTQVCSGSCAAAWGGGRRLAVVQ